jgi:hypothetical protein
MSRVEISGKGVGEIGRDVLKAEHDRWKRAAREVERTVRCPEHGEAPRTTFSKSSSGWNVELSACCETAKQMAQTKLEQRIARR